MPQPPPPPNTKDRAVTLKVVIECAAAWLPTARQMAESRRTLTGRLASRARLLERTLRWYREHPGDTGLDERLIAEAEALIEKLRSQLPVAPRSLAGKAFAFTQEEEPQMPDFDSFGDEQEKEAA